MNKVKIFGLIGENLGDEALGVAAYDLFKKELNHVDLKIGEVILCRASRNGLNSFYIDRKTIRGILNLFKEIIDTDVVVVGGGSLIQDKIGISLFRGTLPYIFQVCFIAKLMKKQVVSLPIGVDHLYTRLGKFYAKLTLRCIDNIFVRDNESLVNAEKYGSLSKGKVTKLLDPAFAYDRVNTSKSKKCSPYVVIALAKERYEYKDYYSSLYELCKKSIKNGLKIKLISMDEKKHEDPLLNSEISKKMQLGDNVEVIEPGNNLEYIIDLLRSADLVIAMRLHAAILAYGYSKIIMISRTTKTDALMNEYSIPGVKLERNKPLSENALIDIYENSFDIDFEDRPIDISIKALNGLKIIAKTLSQ